MIGIISDTHDNVNNVLKAIKIFENNNVDFIVHCGDVVSPLTMKHFNGIHTKLVKGNCDGEVDGLKKTMEDIKGEYLGEVGKLNILGKKIIIYHGEKKDKLQDFIDGQEFDFILTGHTHESRDEKKDKTRIINPGAHYYGGENKVVLLDVEKDKVEFIEVQ
ncbi:MAG: metallophosphoesterase [Nanoarchaeota archaeon]|nr:metallophosphoesterase [Nanoarchaeota archaeon]